LEKSLFLEVREQVKTTAEELYIIADRIADLDCLCSFAYAATRNGYVRPTLVESNTLSIIDGRHPVVENHLPTGEFVPNTIQLDADDTLFALITGPNMAGKSTFLRQTALIVLLAHTGSFVPASEARIGIVDKLFCRVGATDNLARGESTFLVEMNEAAHILRSSTEKSLVIMDEIGRGTSTNDGLAIAQAITEHLLEKNTPKTLFATHFHELTTLEHPKLKKLYLDIIENGKEIVFLKKVKEGISNNSYGIHVATLAGVPDEVVLRAQNVLSTLETRRLSESENVPDGSIRTMTVKQGELFSEYELIIENIQSINPDSITPLEALQYISEWKKKLK
jgi:DNA mismatch repair protein MutS